MHQVPCISDDCLDLTLLVKDTPAWVYKRALILNCNHIFYILLSYLIYSYIIYSPTWITLLYSKYFGLFLCERTLFVSFGIRASLIPAFGHALTRVTLTGLLAT